MHIIVIRIRIEVMDFGHTNYKDKDTGDEVHLPFPAKLLIRLATDKGMDIQNLSSSDAKELFVQLIKDWLKGTISTENLSSIANYFLTLVSDKEGLLHSRLIDASELSYYIRFPGGRSHEPFHGFVSRLREYRGVTAHTDSSSENKRYNAEVNFLDGLFEFHPRFFEQLEKDERISIERYYLTGKTDIPDNILDYRLRAVRDHPKLEHTAHEAFKKLLGIAGIEDFKY